MDAAGETDMDCDKCESAMMDELYGELDEVTSAAVKRHVAGCARCAAQLSGLQATRRLAAVPLVEPPATLEPRILDAATRALGAAASATASPTGNRSLGADEAPSLGRRLARAISIAGSWAMRPQTAMAALFLVMVGVAVPLLREKRAHDTPASARVTVTEQGAPAPAALASSLQPASAAADKAPAEPDLGVPRDRAYEVPVVKPQSTLAPTRAAAPAADEVAWGHDVPRREAPPRQGVSAWAAQPAGAPPAALARPKAAADPFPMAALKADGPSAGAVARAEAPPPPAPAAAPAAAAPAPPAQPVVASAPADDSAQSAFNAALQAYRTRRYDEAWHAFEALAPADPNADLWAARSLREAHGCSAAAPRFDQVARRAPAAPTGWDALLEGALCYRALHDYDSARSRLTTLLGVDAYRERARAELDRLARMQQGQLR